MAQAPKPGESNPRVGLSGTLIESANDAPGRSPVPPEPVERSQTVLETDDDVRQALLSAQKRQRSGAAVGVGSAAPASPLIQQPAGRTAVAYRPTVRTHGRSTDRMRRREDKRRGHPHS